MDGAKSRGEFETLDALANVSVVNARAAAIANRHPFASRSAKDGTARERWQGWELRTEQHGQAKLKIFALSSRQYSQ